MKTEGADYSLDTIRLLSRWYRLRQQGKLFPIIQSGISLYRFDNPADPWGSRSVLHLDELRKLIELEEFGRKPVQSETLAAKEQEKTA